MSSVLALFRRAANVVARLEDAVVFRGLPAGGSSQDLSVSHLANHGRASRARGLDTRPPPAVDIQFREMPAADRGKQLVGAVSEAIGHLEQNGHFGPFAAVLGQRLFLVAQTPDPGSLVLPQDRIIPFLGGGPLLRSSTLDEFERVHRRGRGARGRATRTRRRHGHVPPVPPGHPRPSLLLPCLREDCASHQGACRDRPSLYAAMRFRRPIRKTAAESVEKSRATTRRVAGCVRRHSASRAKGVHGMPKEIENYHFPRTICLKPNSDFGLEEEDFDLSKAKVWLDDVIVEPSSRGEKDLIAGKPRSRRRPEEIVVTTTPASRSHSEGRSSDSRLRSGSNARPAEAQWETKAGGRNGNDDDRRNRQATTARDGKRPSPRAESEAAKSAGKSTEQGPRKTTK